MDASDKAKPIRPRSKVSVDTAGIAPENITRRIISSASQLVGERSERRVRIDQFQGVGGQVGKTLLPVVHFVIFEQKSKCCQLLVLVPHFHHDRRILHAVRNEAMAHAP